MLEARSPIVGVDRVTGSGVKLEEASGFVLTQVAGTDSALKKSLGSLPAKLGTAAERNGRTIMRIGSDQFWLLGPPPSQETGIFFTPLSSSRTRFLLEGEKARDVLASCAAVDFSVGQFKPGQFAITGIHHSPVLIHCIEKETFHIYAMRTFALSIWDWLADVIEGLRD